MTEVTRNASTRRWFSARDPGKIGGISTGPPGRFNLITRGGKEDPSATTPGFKEEGGGPFPKAAFFFLRGGKFPPTPLLKRVFLFP